MKVRSIDGAGMLEGPRPRFKLGSDQQKRLRMGENDQDNENSPKLKFTRRARLRTCLPIYTLLRHHQLLPITLRNIQRHQKPAHHIIRGHRDRELHDLLIRIPSFQPLHQRILDFNIRRTLACEL